MYKVKEITPVKARYIKLVPKISSNTVRIYGFRFMDVNLSIRFMKML